MTRRSLSWARRTLELEPGAGNTPERTHRDGYEGRVASDKAAIDELRRQVQLRRLYQRQGGEQHGEGFPV